MEIIMSVVKILLVILGLGICGFFMYDNNKEKVQFSIKSLLGLIPIGLSVAMCCLTIIPSNTVGVLYSPLNGTSENTLQEGIHFKLPFDQVYEIDTTIQERTQDGTKVQTKDAQVVTMSVNVKYQVSKDNAFVVYKGYRTLEKLNKNIIANYAQTTLNEVCVKYNVIDILGEKRNEILAQTNELLLEKYASEGVTLKEITIKNIDAGEAIEKAIQNEAVAKKNAETAKQDQEKAKTEAETKLIQAEGEAKANAVKTKELTDKILLEQWISRWDGKLSIVSGSDSNMIDISELLKEKVK